MERRLYKEGKRDEAAIIRQVLALGARNFSQQFKCQDAVTKFSKDEALALMTDTKLSRYQYNYLREQCLLRNADLLSNYNQIVQNLSAILS